MIAALYIGTILYVIIGVVSCCIIGGYVKKQSRDR